MLASKEVKVAASITQQQITQLRKAFLQGSGTAAV